MESNTPHITSDTLLITKKSWNTPYNSITEGLQAPVTYWASKLGKPVDEFIKDFNSGSLDNWFSVCPKEIKNILTESVYLEMKRLVTAHESKSLTNSINDPYLKTVSIDTTNKYNPHYGDDRLCECGHAYYRQFDTYEDMDPIGCKYCSCRIFKEKVNSADNF